MIYQGNRRYPVNEICLHTTATAGDWWVGKTVTQMRDEVRLWHMKDNGWRDIGYHRLFAPDGKRAVGRSIYEIGAGVMGHNRGVIHLVMVPVNAHKGITRFEDYFTEAQRDAVRSYIAEVRTMTKIDKITGHNDYASKECPGFKVKWEDWAT